MNIPVQDLLLGDPRIAGIGRIDVEDRPIGIRDHDAVIQPVHYLFKVNAPVMEGLQAVIDLLQLGHQLRAVTLIHHKPQQLSYFSYGGILVHRAPPHRFCRALYRHASAAKGFKRSVP